MKNATTLHYWNKRLSDSLILAIFWYVCRQPICGNPRKFHQFICKNEKLTAVLMIEGSEKNAQAGVLAYAITGIDDNTVHAQSCRPYAAKRHASVGSQQDYDIT